MGVLTASFDPVGQDLAEGCVDPAEIPISIFNPAKNIMRPTADD
jgi:hypothetical protein